MIKYIAVVSYIVLIFGVSSTSKKYNPQNKELLRKIIHIGIGPLIPIAIYLNFYQLEALAFTGLITLLIGLNYLFKIFPNIEDVNRKSYGTLFYCISLFLLIYIFWNRDPVTLIVGCFIMTFGDGLAGLIGKNISSNSWTVFNQKKSILGTFIMFITSFLILLFLGFEEGYGLNIHYLTISILVTILEQFSFVGIDNLSVPLIASFSFNCLVTNL